MTPTRFAGSQDLHHFLSAYASAYPEDVITITERVPDSQDVAALVWRLSEMGRREMLRFKHLDGFPHEVVTNMFACRRRVSRILDTEPGNLHAGYQARARNLIPPVDVDDGPALEHSVQVDSIDLYRFPLLTHFSTDRAPYVTSGIMVAEGENGIGNLSYQRAMVHSPTEFATSLHSRGDLWRMLSAAADNGRSLPVAMVMGGHPLFMMAASARVPMTVDERHVAGGLFGSPLQVVRTPLYGIGVPATADFVFEGVIDPTGHVPEGPFGEFTGYSADRSTHSLFKVEGMYHRADPVLLDIVGGASDEHLNLGRIPREAEMAEKLKDRFPDVIALHYPNSGSHFHCYVKLHRNRTGQARQVMLGLLGWDPYLKTVVAVDSDIDITNDSEVLWALATRFQPAEDLLIVDGLPGSPLDPSSSPTGTTSRLGIDATCSDEFDATRIRISNESLERVGNLITDRLSFRNKE